MMKYTIRHEQDGTHTLLRYGEVAPNGGRPTNAELEFWVEIERLREEVNKTIPRITHALAPEDAKVLYAMAVRESGDNHYHLYEGPVENIEELLDQSEPPPKYRGEFEGHAYLIEIHHSTNKIVRSHRWDPQAEAWTKIKASRVRGLKGKKRRSAV